ncbi:MAG: ATP-binding protein [Thermoanaerobaculia bacterium]|nr:ATP-binding protein [Thermoanaerobaculia bacterium]
MKLSAKFILFIAVIHVVTFYVFRENKILFLVSEFFILLSLAVSWSLYQELIRPLQLLVRGTDAIKDRDFNVKFVKTGKYEMDKLIEVYNEMIDQLRTERTTQQEQHYFLQKLVQTAPTGIVMLDYDGHIDSVNPRALEWTGYAREWSDLRGKNPADLSHPVFQTIAWLKTGESKTITLPNAKTFKIQKSQFVDRGFPRGFVMIEELTAEILEAEKRSYGKVIRMMAHEVNNSIGAVNSILDTTLQLHTGAPEIREALAVAIERNEHLNQFMRNFADVIRLPEPRPERFDLHELLKKVVQLMEFKAREREVTFEWELTEKPLFVRADAGQLEQVLINVIKNALEAIGKQGVIRFHTTHRPFRLTITDTGKGIPKEAADKLFTPFFSDKAGGQGIGLTLTREILTAHGFPFSLKTGPDGLTRFEITFAG